MIEFEVPVFDLVEPDKSQRWSTWFTTIPTHRGPEPWPDWVVTSTSAIDTELGIVKSGKEADVFLIERAVPGTPGVVLAAKRYRSAEVSDFPARRSTRREGAPGAVVTPGRSRTRAPSAVRSPPITGPLPSSML